MKLGKRSKGDEVDVAAKAAAEAEAAAGAEPASDSWTAADERAASPDPDPVVVEGEAVELTGSAPAAEPAARPVPPTIHRQPATSDPPPPAPSFDGHVPVPPADPLEPIRVLADQRPELVVGAAFAGGILAAMILRRLGN